MACHEEEKPCALRMCPEKRYTVCVCVNFFHQNCENILKLQSHLGRHRLVIEKYSDC